MSDALALEVHAALSADSELTVGELAKQLDASFDDVYFVLDEYYVDPDGPVHHGPGQGGNWVPVAQQELAFAPGESAEIGRRGPDGELGVEG